MLSCLHFEGITGDTYPHNQQPAWLSQAELLAYELYDPVGESQVYVLRFLIFKF